MNTVIITTYKPSDSPVLCMNMCVCVFVFTGLGCRPGFADVLQDRISLFIFSIFLFLGTTQLWGEEPLSHVMYVNV